jgi:hypothetical protein
LGKLTCSPPYRREERVVVRRLRAGAGYDRGKPRRLRHRNAARVEVVHERAEPDQCRVVLQTEAGQHHLEGHATARVCELRVVEVEADGALRAIPDSLQPAEAGLRVDEAPDEPRAGYPVDPQPFAGRPHALPITLHVAAPHGGRRFMRLVGGEARVERGLGVGECPFRLLAGGTGKEIDLHRRGKLAAQHREATPGLDFGESCETLPELGESADDGRIALGAVEQGPEPLLLIERPAGERQDVRRAAAFGDLERLLLEERTPGLAVGKDVNPVAQRLGPSRPQRPPDAHAQRLIPPRKVCHQHQPRRAVHVYYPTRLL